VQERSTSATRPVHNLFGQDLEVIGIVCLFVADQVNGTGPTSSEANNLITLPQRANGYRANCGIKTGNVATTGENANDSRFCLDVRHCFLSFDLSRGIECG
jgi:hypothetical protein